MRPTTDNRILHLLLAGIASAAVGLAQSPVSPNPTSPNPPSPATPVGKGEPAAPTVPENGGRTSLDAYTESTSRELFSACDADSDDRLDLFEACDALETLASPKDSAAFLRFDTSRDGYLQWPEFDAHYRELIEKNGEFHVRTCRRFVRQAKELQAARKATPLELFIQLNDRNENGGLDPEEISKIARDIKLLPAFEAQLRMLDVNQSGQVEAAELAPIFEQLRSAVALPGLEQAPPPSGLPAPWGEVDGDGNGMISRAELEGALRKLDPALLRWAAQILAKLDKNRDGKLSAPELALPGAASPTTL